MQRDGRPATDEEVAAAVFGDPLPVMVCHACKSPENVSRYVLTADKSYWEYFCAECFVADTMANLAGWEKP